MVIGKPARAKEKYFTYPPPPIGCPITYLHPQTDASHLLVYVKERKGVGHFELEGIRSGTCQCHQDWPLPSPHPYLLPPYIRQFTATNWSCYCTTVHLQKQVTAVGLLCLTKIQNTSSSSAGPWKDWSLTVTWQSCNTWKMRLWYSTNNQVIGTWNHVCINPQEAYMEMGHGTNGVESMLAQV